MEIIPSIKEAVKDAVHKELEGATINNIPISEFLEKANNAVENNDCNLTTCRYNRDRKCTNDEKRKECVEVSRKVLCLDEN